MSRRLTSIDLVMENCEGFRIPVKYVHTLAIEDIKRSCGVHINGYVDGADSWELGEEWEHFSSDDIFISLNREGVKDIQDFHHFNTLEERVQKWDDLCQIIYNYSDKTEKQFLVTWNDKPLINSHDEENEWQHVVITKHSINIFIDKNFDENEAKVLSDVIDWEYPEE